MTEDSKKTLGNVVQIDEKRINDHLGELVRGTVEETLHIRAHREHPFWFNLNTYSGGT